MFTITKYTGLDPEINLRAYGANNDRHMGVDEGAYPAAKTFLIGANPELLILKLIVMQLRKIFTALVLILIGGFVQQQIPGREAQSSRAAAGPAE